MRCTLCFTHSHTLYVLVKIWLDLEIVNTAAVINDAANDAVVEDFVDEDAEFVYNEGLE